MGVSDIIGVPLFGVPTERESDYFRGDYIYM